MTVLVITVILLPVYVQNSLIILGRGLTRAVLIRATTGWLVAVNDFPGLRVFEWALMPNMARLFADATSCSTLFWRSTAPVCCIAA